MNRKFKEPFEITDSDIVNSIRDLTDTCDGDVLAALCEFAFGGQVTTEDGHTYTVYPNEFYSGEFDFIAKAYYEAQEKKNAPT